MQKGKDVGSLVGLDGDSCVNCPHKNTPHSYLHYASSPHRNAPILTGTMQGVLGNFNLEYVMDQKDLA